MQSVRSACWKVSTSAAAAAQAASITGVRTQTVSGRLEFFRQTRSTGAKHNEAGEGCASGVVSAIQQRVLTVYNLQCLYSNALMRKAFVTIFLGLGTFLLLAIVLSGAGMCMV